MASAAFGAVRADVLNLLPGTVAADFDAAGSASTPIGEAEIDAELGRQERSMRARMSPDLVAKVNARAGTIQDLADVCAQCAAARLGIRVEGADSGNAPLHVAQLAADCEAAMNALQAGRFTPAGLGSNDPPPAPAFRCIPCERG